VGPGGKRYAKHHSDKHFRQGIIAHVPIASC